MQKQSQKAEEETKSNKPVGELGPVAPIDISPEDEEAEIAMTNTYYAANFDIDPSESDVERGLTPKRNTVHKLDFEG